MASLPVRSRGGGGTEKEITVAEQGLYWFPVSVTLDQARERAWEQKLNVFGTLSRLLMRPKGEEIQVSLQEQRYQPFWHAASHKRFRYDRGSQYHLAVSLDVQTVEIAGESHAATGGKVTLQAVDHCLVEERREIFLDALTGESQDLGRYLSSERVAVEDGQALPQDLALVPPAVRASVVVREVLGDVLRPPSADQVFEEEVVVDRLDLYYRPVYAFEYTWEAKGKRMTVEVDGLTGEFSPTGKTFGGQLRRVLTREILFDLGGEALNLVVPGGAIPLKLAKAVMDRRVPKG